MIESINYMNQIIDLTHVIEDKKSPDKSLSSYNVHLLCMCLECIHS